jgi:mono/diheme cytochrome c family protein
VAAAKTPEANLVAAVTPGVLPPGTGKAIVERSCQNCHGLKVITSKHASPGEWHSTVQLMVSRGAQVSPQEMQTVTRYLASHFPPLNASSTSPGALPLLHGGATGTSNAVKQ